MGAMGERFVLYRLPESDPTELARRSLLHVGRETEMRRDLRAAVTSFMAGVTLPEAVPQPADQDIERLITIATFAVKARSAVERDSYRREIELIPQAESPTRLANALARMLVSLRLIGIEEPEAWRIVTKLGLDSIPAIRRSVIDFLAVQAVPVGSSEVAEACRYPKTTAERALEDLVAHGVVSVKRPGSGKPTEWRFSAWAQEKWAKIATSSDIPPLRVEGDLKGAAVGSGISEDVRTNGVGAHGGRPRQQGFPEGGGR
jgi:hypothetical protein